MTKSLVMPPPHPPTLMVVPPLSHRDSKKFVSWSRVHNSTTTGCNKESKCEIP